MMNTHFNMKWIILTVVLAIAGCTSAPWSMTDSGVQIETVASPKVRMHVPIVTEKPQGFELSGQFSGQHRPAPPLNGHVEVDILDSQGQVIRSGTTTIHRFGKVNRPHRTYKYRINIPQVPPRGGVIRISYHEGK